METPLALASCRLSSSFVLFLQKLFFFSLFSPLSVLWRLVLILEMAIYDPPKNQAYSLIFSYSLSFQHFRDVRWLLIKWRRIVLKMHKHFVRKIIRSQWAKLTFLTNFLHKSLVCCTLLHNFSKAVDIKDKKMAFSWKAVGCSFSQKRANVKFELRSKRWQTITLFNWQLHENTHSRKNFSWECSMIGNIRSSLLEIFSR